MIKKIQILIILLSVFITASRAQKTITKTIVVGSVTRSYIIYIPARYTGATAVPLLFNFHGSTLTALWEMSQCDFRPIADTANFIIAHPQGTVFNNETHWNVGGWTKGSPSDDLGFTSALIDTISSEYNIDLKRVYATGFSNGGYFCFELACHLRDRIAAIASVGGSMTPDALTSCNPQRPTPVLQIHGTADGIVPYKGADWTIDVPSIISYWTKYDKTDSVPTITNMPDIITTDGSTAQHMVYLNGNNGTSIEHYKIASGSHSWPGKWGNMDINASKIVWDFLSKYNLFGSRFSRNTGINDSILKLNKIEMYPNPTTGKFTISQDTDEAEIIITEISGQLILKTQTTKKDTNLTIENKGIYIVYVKTKYGTTARKLIRK